MNCWLHLSFNEEISVSLTNKYSYKQHRLLTYEKYVSSEACESLCEGEVSEFGDIIHKTYHLRTSVGFTEKLIEEHLSEFDEKKRKR